MIDGVKMACAGVLLALGISFGQEMTKEIEGDVTAGIEYNLKNLKGFENVEFKYDFGKNENDKNIVFVYTDNGVYKDSVFAQFEPAFDTLANENYYEMHKSDFVKNHEKEIVSEQFKMDLELFSKNLAKNPDIQKVFAKRGIKDIEGWFANKIKGKKATYETEKTGDMYNPANDVVNISGVAGMHQKDYARTHETAHKISAQGPTRIGFETQTWDGEKLVLQGRGLNERSTNYFAKMMTDDPDLFGKSFVDDLANVVGRDKFIEAYLFDPNILAKEFAERTGDKNAYEKFLLLCEADYYGNEYRRASHQMAFKATKNHDKINFDIDAKAEIAKRIEILKTKQAEKGVFTKLYERLIGD